MADNLLDKASILLTPTAYDNGSMLSIKPENGDGDFTFSRAGNAGRVNSSGNIVTESANIPRIDYTDGCGSWLLEGQSTNLIPYSSDFSQWNLASGASIDINQITSPDGTQNATKLNTTGASSRVQQSLVLSGINTISIFVKYAGDDVTVRFERNTANDRCTFDISSSGVVFNSAESGITSYDIKEFSNDWYRISCSYDGGNYFQFNGDITGGGGSVYIWGAQAENQPYATSYIPTNGATNTRLQDIPNNSGNSTLIDSTEGVLYAEISALANDGTTRRFCLSDGTSSQKVLITFSATTNRIQFEVINTTNQFYKEYVSSNLLDFHKVAIKYKQNDFNVYVNGVEVHSSTSGNVPVGLNKLSFDNGIGSQKLYGKVKAVAVYKEALTDAELQSLTTI